MEVRARISVPDADAKEIVSTYTVAAPTPDSTKGLAGMLESIAAVQRQTQQYLTEIVNKDPSAAATAALEDLYGEEGADEGDEEADTSAEKGPPKKKKKKK
eukprot:Tamp_27470.p3 GENE.Tamp_27470~~Tamp_27470.p3  ORF type:complete len:101 (-),score=34.62 Tamp_27470:447-749(-)